VKAINPVASAAASTKPSHARQAMSVRDEFAVRMMAAILPAVWSQDDSERAREQLRAAAFAYALADALCVTRRRKPAASERAR
jgi:hypothetical protein